MKLGYIFSLTLVPFMIIGTLAFNQGNSDKNKGQNGNKDPKQNPARVEKQNGPQNNKRKTDAKGKENIYIENQAARKNRNDDRYDKVKGDNQNGKKGLWKEEDRWEDGRWDDNRFEVRMKKLKGFKRNNWINTVYYPGIVWFDNNNYYNASGPRGNKKVTICHKPNGNVYPVMISVSANAVNAHLRHGDYLGECRNYDRSRYSNKYWNTRNNYYNQYSQTTETLSFGEQLLITAIDVLTNRRTQLANSRSTLQEDELRRKEAAIINLQNDVYNLQNSLDRSNEQVGLQVNLKF